MTQARTHQLRHGRAEARQETFLRALDAGLRVEDAITAAGWASRSGYKLARQRDTTFADRADEALVFGWLRRRFGIAAAETLDDWVIAIQEADGLSDVTVGPVVVHEPAPWVVEQHPVPATID